MRPMLELIAILPGSASWLDPLGMATIKGTVLIGVAGLAATLLRRAPAATRHLVWTLALLGVLGIPLASLIVPAWPVRWLPAPARPALEQSRVVPRPSIERARATSTTATSHSNIGPILSTVDPGAVHRSTDATSAAGMAAMRADRQSAPAPHDPTPGPGRRPFTREDAARALPWVWIAGAALVFGRRMLASRRLAQLSRRASPVTDPAWRAALSRHTAQLGIRRAVSLRVSGEVDVPMTWGTIAPVVLLPAGSAGWSANRRSIVLLHELAHVRRRDTLTLLLAHVALAVYWFHPLVWMAVRHLRAEAERACDDQVLRAGLRPSDFACVLLEIARAAGSEDRLASAALAMARRSQLEGRLLAILDPRQPRGTSGRAALIAALLVAAGGISLLAAVRPAESRLAPLPVESTISARPSTPASKSPLQTRTETRVSTAATATTWETRTVDTPAADEAVPTPPATPMTAGQAVDTPPAPNAAGWDVTPAPAAPPTAGVPAAPAPEAVPPSAPVADAATAPVASAASHSASRTTTTHSSWSVNDDDHTTSWNGVWNGPGFEAKFKGKGEMKFNRDLTDIESLAPGGTITIEETRFGRKVRAEFRGGTPIERRYWVNGESRPWDAEARAWLAKFLLSMDRGSGMFASQRFPMLMADGGPDRVLQEIALMTSDYGKGVYFQKLLAAPLTDAQLRKVVEVAGREVKSDYELARALSAAADKQALSNEATRASYLHAVDGISSDYEHARILMRLVERNDLSPELTRSALESASHLKSDYERARLLSAMIDHGHVRAEVQRDFLRSASELNSDYEKGRVLKALVDRVTLDDGAVRQLLVSAATIHSDYERASLLVSLADRVRLEGATRAAYREVARQLSSYERKRALAALGENEGE